MPAKDIQIEGFPCTIVYGKNNRLANLLSVSPPQHRLRPKLSPKRDSLKPWILIRQKVRQFAQLSKGWDSYNAAPPSREAIQNTLTFLKLLESVQLYPDWVEPTSDDSIMLEVRVGGVLEEWDFYSDGDVAVLHEFPTGQTECRMVNPALWEMAVQLFAPTYGKK